MRIIREWRHIRLLKRMGRGHLDGVHGTKEGECAVLCPACPYPGINLPEDWKSKPESQQYEFYLLFCILLTYHIRY